MTYLAEYREYREELDAGQRLDEERWDQQVEDIELEELLSQGIIDQAEYREYWNVRHSNIVPF